MEITKRRLADIVPYAANAKKHDKRQINNVAESIKQYGFVQPIVIDRDGVIVIGHCRALAAKKLGMEEVPCVCVDDLTPEQVNALRLVDNKSNNVMNGIAFGQSAAARYIKSKRSFDIVYTIEDNIFKKNQVQLQIEDIRPNNSEK